MTEDNCPKVSEELTANAAATARQRKKRKWDQPAESLASVGLVVPGVLPSGNMGTLVGITLPGVAPVSGALSMNPLPATCAAIPQVLHASLMQQNATALVQQLNHPKIQDELIAREIVINDAESTVRYKLTKRLTQEEIQRCSGAVVITRGKYRPPNALPDNEKPLYLHISAGAHLKETAERIKAVDCAAAMVEEMLKQGQNSLTASNPFHSLINAGGQVPQPLSTSVFLGFDTDPSLNIAARIRGPNDQYINHIMNETGATVLLRGLGSGTFEGANKEELQQPLHLYLSSNNPKGLENAKLLAENLLDTISAECGASRVSSCKGYSAVPPPQQLLAGVQGSGKEEKIMISSPISGLTSTTVGSMTVGPVSAVTVSGISNVFPQATVSQPGVPFNYRPPQLGHPNITGGTSYSGYGGIYPQATPLQQVALALRQSPSPVSPTISPTTSAGITTPKASSISTTEKNKRPPHKRKFQELPVAPKEPAKLKNSPQGSEFLKPGVPSEDLVIRDISTMPPPKKLAQASKNGMPPPSPRNVPTMPPPPPKFISKASLPKANGDSNVPVRAESDTIPDTLIKLMEYGEEEDDDPDLNSEEHFINNSKISGPKPFWAV